MDSPEYHESRPVEQSPGDARPTPLWLQPRVHLVIVAAIYLIAAWQWGLTGNSVPSFTWSWVYSENEMKEIAQSWDSVWAFYRDLRIPVPPAIVSLELVSYWLTGQFDLVTVYLYRLILASVFFVSIVSLKRGIAGYWISLALSVSFLWATSKIHPLNPQLYDLWVPLCFLLFVLFLRKSTEPDGSAWRSYGFAFLAGCFLALTETSRPFVLVLLPFLLAFTFIHFYRRNWRLFLVFLLPLLIISGGWHAKLIYFNDGQLLLTNNSGFNLRRAWEPVAPMPEATYEMKPGWKYYNNPEHIHASNELKNKVIRFIFQNPFDAAKHVTDRIAELFKPMTHDTVMPLQVDIARPLPQNHPWLPVYTLLVRVCGVGLLVILILALRGFILNPSWAFWGRPEWIVLFFTFMSVLFLAAGESGEDFRFLISVLPCLAALQPVSSIQKTERSRPIHLWAPVVVVCFLVAFLWVKADYDRRDGRLLLPDNLALQAKVSVSSSWGSDSPEGLIDGIVAGHPGPMIHEWVTQGEGAGAWAMLEWEEPQTIQRIELFDRPNSEDQVLGGAIYFTGEGMLPFSQLENTAETPYRIWFEPRQTKNVMIVINHVKPGSPNIGLAEAAVFSPVDESIFGYSEIDSLPPAEANRALSASVEVSSNYGLYDVGGAIDGILGGNPDNNLEEWASDGEGEGAWIRLSWDEPVSINRIALFDRPNPADQILSGSVLLDGNTQIVFDALPNDGKRGVEIHFPEEKISELMVVVTNVREGTINAGLSEVAAWRAP